MLTQTHVSTQERTSGLALQLGEPALGVVKLRRNGWRYGTEGYSGYFTGCSAERGKAFRPCAAGARATGSSDL
jgi:hypothetical protein